MRKRRRKTASRAQAYGSNKTRNRNIGFVKYNISKINKNEQTNEKFEMENGENDGTVTLEMKEQEEELWRFACIQLYCNVNGSVECVSIFRKIGKCFLDDW